MPGGPVSRRRMSESYRKHGRYKMSDEEKAAANKAVDDSVAQDKRMRKQYPELYK